MPFQLSCLHADLAVSCRAHDVQVEFTMLDPHVRATLKPDSKVGSSLWRIGLA